MRRDLKETNYKTTFELAKSMWLAAEHGTSKKSSDKRISDLAKCIVQTSKRALASR